MLKKKTFLVFRHPHRWTKLVDVRHPFKWTWLDQEKIDSFFSRDVRIKNTFRDFLAEGFTGLVWHNDGEWASYAWMSLPETDGPPHLSRWIKRLPVYWIFYCRTKEKYQGKGLFKASLSLLVNWVRERDPQAEIYIDTEAGNIPSKRAIEAVGFTPKGIITTWSLRLPKLSLVLLGRWHQDAPHAEAVK